MASAGTSRRVSEGLAFVYFFGALGGTLFGYSATLGQEPEVVSGAGLALRPRVLLTELPKGSRIL